MKQLCPQYLLTTFPVMRRNYHQGSSCTFFCFIASKPRSFIGFPSNGIAISRRSCSPETAKRRRSYRAVVKSCAEPDWKDGPVDSDIAKDRTLVELEKLLDVALKEEDHSQVDAIEEQLLRLQSDAYVEVLTANMKFYRAFHRNSLVDMAGCWMQDSSVTCKHPLGPLVIGYIDVIDSFGYLFSVGIPAISSSNIRITMRGSVALVTCEEHAEIIEEKVEEEERKALITESNPNFSTKSAPVVMLATNIFEKKNGQWYLTHHVSSPKYPSDF